MQIYSLRNLNFGNVIDMSNPKLISNEDFFNVLGKFKNKDVCISKAIYTNSQIKSKIIDIVFCFNDTIIDFVFDSGITIKFKDNDSLVLKNLSIYTEKSNSFQLDFRNDNWDSDTIFYKFNLIER